MGIDLLIGSKKFTGFQEVSCSASLNEVARSFSFKTFQDLGLFIDAGQEAKVYIDDHLIITGYTERIDTNVDSSGTSLTIAGRSKTADFIDCSPELKGGSSKNTNIINIADKIAEPFGINVIADVSVKNIKYTAINEGETCLDYLDRLSRQEGFALTTNPAGDLVITQAGKTQLKGRIHQTETPILSASASRDYSQRFSEYKVKGQDDDTSFISSFKDKAITRHRPTIIMSEGTPTDPSNRAINHAMRTIGQSISMNVSVGGFYTNEKELYEINKLIYVYHEYLRLDQIMLIEGVTYKVEADSFGCDLILVDPRAYYADKPKVNKSSQDMQDLPHAKQ